MGNSADGKLCTIEARGEKPGIRIFTQIARTHGRQIGDDQTDLERPTRRKLEINCYRAIAVLNRVWDRLIICKQPHALKINSLCGINLTVHAIGCFVTTGKMN